LVFKKGNYNADISYFCAAKIHDAHGSKTKIESQIPRSKARSHCETRPEKSGADAAHQHVRPRFLEDQLVACAAADAGCVCAVCRFHPVWLCAGRRDGDPEKPLCAGRLQGDRTHFRGG